MWDSDPIEGDPLNRVRFRVVARGKTVTQCYYSSSDEQAEFDARLIAAAPDLAAAVRRQVENIERWRETGIPATPEESKSIYEQLLAALTRATGG